MQKRVAQKCLLAMVLLLVSMLATGCTFYEVGDEFKLSEHTKNRDAWPEDIQMYCDALQLVYNVEGLDIAYFYDESWNTVYMVIGVPTSVQDLALESLPEIYRDWLSFCWDASNNLPDVDVKHAVILLDSSYAWSGTILAKYGQ